MKPTDEAKRLRDEINGIIADMVCDNQSSELTEEIISKVLDAAVDATTESSVNTDYSDIAINAINKLRP